MIKLIITCYVITVSFISVINANEYRLIPKSYVPLPCNRPINLVYVGIGLQKSFFTEIGISRTRHNGFNHEISYTYYCGLELFPAFNFNKEQNIYGIKGGCKIGLYSLSIILEPVYLTDFTKYNVQLTPKVGIEFYYFNVSYGYNFNIIGKPIFKIGQNQFTVQLYLRDIFKRYY